MDLWHSTSGQKSLSTRNPALPRPRGCILPMAPKQNCTLPARTVSSIRTSNGCA